MGKESLVQKVVKGGVKIVLGYNPDSRSDKQIEQDEKQKIADEKFKKDYPTLAKKIKKK